MGRKNNALKRIIIQTESVRYFHSVRIGIVCVFFSACVVFGQESEANFATAFSQQDNTRVSPYIVKDFDTLWDLAFHFYGDPFTWQRIWEANRYIRDPHWIYPGDTLIIPDIPAGSSFSGVGQSYAQSTKTTPANAFGQDRQGAARQSADDYFASLRKDFLRDNLYAGGDKTDTSSWTIGTSEIRAVYEKGYFGAEMLRRIPFIWTKRDVKKIVLPGDARIDDERDKPAFQEFSRVKCTIFGEQVYSVGDTVDIYHKMEFLRLNGQPAALVKRVGFGCVEEVEKRSMAIYLFKIWDLVRNDDRIARMEPVKHYEIRDVVSTGTSQGVTVISRCETTECPYLFQTLLVDKGSSQQIQLGDVFLVYPKQKKSFSRVPSMAGIAMRVEEESATLMIIKMFNTSLKPGDYAKLTKRVELTRVTQ